MWLFCFSPVRPGPRVAGITSCGVYGGRYAQQQVLPREVGWRSKAFCIMVPGGLPRLAAGELRPRIVDACMGALNCRVIST